MQKESIIEIKTLNFSIYLIKTIEAINENKQSTLIHQLLRSGTSIGANVKEASAASSKKDFINKMFIASKEARESEYWIKLILNSKYKNDNFEKLLSDIKEIINILTAIIKTSQQNILINKLTNK